MGIQMSKPRLKDRCHGGYMCNHFIEASYQKQGVSFPRWNMQRPPDGGIGSQPKLASGLSSLASTSSPNQKKPKQRSRRARGATELRDCKECPTTRGLRCLGIPARGGLPTHLENLPIVNSAVEGTEQNGKYCPLCINIIIIRLYRGTDSSRDLQL